MTLKVTWKYLREGQFEGESEQRLHRWVTSYGGCGNTRESFRTYSEAPKNKILNTEVT